MTTYCSNDGCGKRIDYAAIKPTICPHCQESLNKAFMVKPKAPAPIQAAHKPAFTITRNDPVRREKSPMLAHVQINVPGKMTTNDYIGVTERVERGQRQPSDNKLLGEILKSTSSMPVFTPPPAS